MKTNSREWLTDRNCAASCCWKGVSFKEGGIDCSFCHSIAVQKSLTFVESAFDCVIDVILKNIGAQNEDFHGVQFVLNGVFDELLTKQWRYFCYGDLMFLDELQYMGDVQSSLVRTNGEFSGRTQQSLNHISNKHVKR